MGTSVRIGTSGWEYRHWAGRFYPRGLAAERRLEFYAERFDTVELNNSFYRLPEAGTFAAWGERVPAGFAFAVKASRYLTHLKRLRDPAEPLDRLWTRARRLGPHLGPMLYQLPPRWRPNHERFERFLAALPRGASHVVEIRDRRWYGAWLWTALEREGVALCLHDMEGSRPRPRRVGPFVYVRFHGAGGRYAGRYSAQRLSAWATRMAEWVGEGCAVWAYFNNDADAQAIEDAERLRTLVERRGAG